MQVPTTTLTPEQVEALGKVLSEQGHVLATLDDWRAILFGFFLLTIVVDLVLVTVIVLLLRANRLERADMTARLDRSLTVADKFGSAASELTGQLGVTQSLNARVETALGSCERLLADLKDSRRGRQE